MPGIDDEDSAERGARQARERALNQRVADLRYARDRMLSGEELAVIDEGGSAPSRDSEGDFLREMQKQIKTGKAAQALEMIDFDMRSRHQVPAINWAMRGLANLVLGNWRACIADAAEALDDEPGFAAAHALQAEAYLRLGEDDKAYEAADQALLFDPEEPRAKDVQAIILRKNWGLSPDP